MKKTILPVLLCLLTMSCVQEGDKNIWLEADSYIYEYIHYDEIRLHVSPEFLSIRVKPSYSYGAYSTSEDDIARYKSKCDLYGDNGYKLVFSTFFIGYYAHSVPDRDLEYIRIYSNKDYVDGYPVGSDLSHLYHMASRSPYKYIESGYTKIYDAESIDFPDYYCNYRNYDQGMYYNFKDGVYPVFGLVSDFKAEDLKLIGFGDFPSPEFEIFTLYPICLPDDMSVHKITVELHDIDGNVLTTTTNVDFSKMEIF